MSAPAPQNMDQPARWLRELTSIPTAAGKEQGVIAWIERWARERPDLRLRADAVGNLVIERAAAGTPPAPPLFITAHLDHPAFVVERIVAPTMLALSFRGGVLDPYFKNARVAVHASDGATLAGSIVEKTRQEPFHECLVELSSASSASGVRVGDIARWSLPEPSIEGDLFHTHACDDLAAAAAALAAMDRLRAEPGAAHVRLLFTRAEEIGFIGAIGACKLRTMPPDSRVLALENSRSFAESPIGAGPIVRVGDRISTFSPALTAGVAKVAERLAETAAKAALPGGSPSISTPGASGATAGPFRWQRKLMPGGACEASAFQAYGYDSTCICLPLGNYHNMADLERVQAGDPAAVSAARVGREFISLSDYRGMIELLVACATRLSGVEPLVNRMEKLYAEKSFVLT